MAIAIRNDPDTKGIEISNGDIHISNNFSLYADDNTLILRGEENALHQILSILKKIAICLGLKLNISKRKIFKIGSFKDPDVVFCPDYHIKWKKRQNICFGGNFHY